MMPPHVSHPPYPQAWHAAPFGAPRAPQRNVALLVVAAVLLLIALGAGLVFVINLHQYLTIEDKWANDPLLSPMARDFGVRIIQKAAMKRMMVFGPTSGVLGIAGLVLGLLGLRKK